VAVVQISRIQIRRGQKNTGTGLPQLASGELGWAIDSQELYIGNGAVSEGAPAVGNTKILTEHDNLFQFADTYVYDADNGVVITGETTTAPIKRTLQARLDDSVSVRAFNIAGDGTDCTVELQRAIDQLFINTATKGSPGSRVVLEMPAGEYTLSDTIYIPPFVTLQGAGIDKTVITQTANVTTFETVNESSTPGTPANDSTSTYLNQARNINMSGFTVNVENLVGNFPVFKIQSCRDSVFSSIKITGSYTNADPDYTDFATGFQLNALSTLVTTQDNIFDDLQIKNIGYAVESDYDVKNNVISNFVFDTLGRGVIFGENTVIGLDGQVTGPLHNVIKSGVMSNLYEYAIWIENGVYNRSEGNKYIAVGNWGGTSSNAKVSVLYFNDDDNLSDNDYFERLNDLSIDQTYIGSSAFVPLVQGKTFFDYDHKIATTIGYQATNALLFRLPGLQTGSYTIDYWYNSNQFNALRSGELRMTFDVATNNIQLSDDFEYVGDPALSNNLSFGAYLSDESGDSVKDTVIITVQNNTLETTTAADIQFRVSATKS